MRPCYLDYALFLHSSKTCTAVQARGFLQLHAAACQRSASVGCPCGCAPRWKALRLLRHHAAGRHNWDLTNLILPPSHVCIFLRRPNRLLANVLQMGWHPGRELLRVLGSARSRKGRTNVGDEVPE